MNLENLGSIYPIPDPELALRDALEKVRQRCEQFGISLIGFSVPCCRLKRQGISFLATIREELTGRTENVPFRAEKALLRSRWSNGRFNASWRGKQIFSIRVDFQRTMNDLVRKVLQCLKTALNRLMHRVQKIFAKRNTAIRKAAQKDPFRRVHAPRLCCH